VTALDSVTAPDLRRTIEPVWRIESARLIAGLVRIVRDVGVAARDDPAQLIRLRFDHLSAVDLPPRSAPSWPFALRSRVSKLLGALLFEVSPIAMRYRGGQREPHNWRS